MENLSIGNQYIPPKFSPNKGENFLLMLHFRDEASGIIASTMAVSDGTNQRRL